MITKTEQEIKELLTTLATLSQSCKDVKAVTDLIRYQHRSHQQSLGRFMKYAIKLYADMYKDGKYDLRNENTCKMCAQIVEQTEEFAIPFI